MQLPAYLRMLVGAERSVADAYRAVASANPDEADVRFTCTGFAADCDQHADALAPVAERYETRDRPDPNARGDRLDPLPFELARSGPVGLLRDLADLLQLATFVESTWTLIGQAAHGARDRELIDLCASSGAAVAGQLAWIRMRLRASAAQALLVA